MNKIIFMNNNSEVTPKKIVKTIRHEITALTS